MTFLGMDVVETGEVVQRMREAQQHLAEELTFAEMQQYQRDAGVPVRRRAE